MRNARGARVVGVADMAPELAAKAAADLGAERAADDYRELLSLPDVDAVDICTTENTHGGIAVDAAERGKHILVEKPIATTLEDADRMIDAAAANGVKLMVAHTHRFYDYSRAAKDAIDAGEIGTPVYVRFVVGSGSWNQDWTGTRVSPGDTGGNVITNGVHLVDTLNSGSGPGRSRYTPRPGISPRPISRWTTTSCSRFATRNGAIGVCELSRANMPRSNEFESLMILGTEGELSSGTQHSSLWSYGDHGLTFGQADGQRGFDAEIQAFVDSLAEGKAPPVSGADGRLALEICLAGQRSIASGEVVMLSEAG